MCYLAIPKGGPPSFPRTASISRFTHASTISDMLLCFISLNCLSFFSVPRLITESGVLPFLEATSSFTRSAYLSSRLSTGMRYSTPIRASLLDRKT